MKRFNFEVILIIENSRTAHTSNYHSYPVEITRPNLWRIQNLVMQNWKPIKCVIINHLGPFITHVGTNGINEWTQFSIVVSKSGLPCYGKF